MAVVEGDDGGEVVAAALGSAIATLIGEFADETLVAQLGGEAAGGSAATAGLGLGAGWLGVEVLGELSIGEADDGVVIGEDGGKMAKSPAESGEKET